MTPDAITTRRAHARAHLAALERACGAATLDGEPFDTAALDAARAELAMLDAAEAEAARRARDEAAELAAAVRTQARERLAATLADYLAAAASAQEWAHELVAALGRVEELAAALRAGVREAGGTVPVALEASQTRLSHSAMLIGELRALGGHGHFGALRWNSVAPVADLAGHARTYVAGALAPIIEEND